ncbi:hypothetical protein CMO91_05365 [Candidatus Woesearchaeota archaeon]|nr:hypothetical protein [Candidatus Woesearchaeota archaeon]|tara:strand:+ start:1316 stop:1822 length:507 start_codon:yes stop_codon:yes gene_type:complete
MPHVSVPEDGIGQDAEFFQSLESSCSEAGFRAVDGHPELLKREEGGSTEFIWLGRPALYIQTEHPDRIRDNLVSRPGMTRKAALPAIPVLVGYALLAHYMGDAIVKSFDEPMFGWLAYLTGTMVGGLAVVAVIQEFFLSRWYNQAEQALQDDSQQIVEGADVAGTVAE